MKAMPFIVFTFFTILTSYSCNNPTDPVDEIPAGRRDYEWTVDTLKIPFMLLSRINGSSPTDVWAIGTGWELSTNIWHYDGTRWTTDGIARNISPYSIAVFGQNNAWLSGSEGKIWHYNGDMWTMKVDFQKLGCNTGFQDIWGSTPSNIYAVGFADSGTVRRGLIFKCDGISWKELTIPFLPYNFVRITQNSSGNGKYYILGYSADLSAFTSALFEFDGKDNLRKIYEGKINSETGAYVQNINQQTFFTIGNKINTYDDGMFKLLLEVTLPNFGGKIYGRSKNDIFLRMLDGIAHYNGTNIEYILKFDLNSDISIVEGIVFENEVFFIASDYKNEQSLIFKGKLK